ncbi:MAG: Histidine kinase [Betaproteobacteria bacterium]|nr:Histidine kinase [Betaproteobacteria bacterium]
MFERTDASSKAAGVTVAKWSSTGVIVASLSGAALLAALVVVLCFWAFRQIETSVADRLQTYTLISQANALLSDITNAETGQRGYSLTGDEAFLKPYLAVRKTITPALEELRALTFISAAQQRLDVLIPLVSAKLVELSTVVESRRDRKMTSQLAAAGGSSQGLKLMESIRIEMNSYIRIEEAVLEQNDELLRSNMRRLFASIVIASLFMFLLAISFAYLIYRESRYRVKDIVHLETQHLLGTQEKLNKQLQQSTVAAEISEEKLAITLNSIGDAVIATDADGRVTLLNPLAQRLTGWTLEDALLRPVEEIFRIINQQTRLPAPVPVRDTLMRNAAHTLEVRTVLISRDGTECDIADSCAPIRTRAGQVVGAVLVFRDVTERTRLDKVLQDHNAELEEAMAMADKANHAKSDFLSSMSHELRTPLSAILGFAQLLESGQPAPTVGQKRSIDQILKAGWYLLDLINEILDLALIESGKLSLSMEPISLAEVMQECEAMIEPQARKRGIRVTFPRFDKPCLIQADRTRVKQIVVNLLSNGIKYNTPGGSVVIMCISTSARCVRLSFTDSGAGLAPEKITQLFEPFNRLGQEAQTEEGTGIGLVMCKRLIELMGGKIGVESTVGSGSVFWVEFNVTTQAPGVAVAAGAIAASPDTGSGTVRTLLYVEDNPANLMLVEDLIARRPDIRLVSARDGISGIEMAHAEKPDVVLMDINLPGISGIEALHVLASDPATAHIPVIALSANAMPRDIEKGLEAGFFRYLTKPIRVNEFMETLDAALVYAKSSAALAFR